MQSLELFTSVAYFQLCSDSLEPASQSKRNAARRGKSSLQYRAIYDWVLAPRVSDRLTEH
jgi:hypothetical protein